MSKKKFIPSKQSLVIAKGAQLHGVLTKPGVVLTTYGVTAQDVTDLGTVLGTAQGAAGDRDAAKETKRAKTNAFSGDGAALDALVAKIQDMGNKIRVSNATDDQALDAGVERRKAGSTPRTISSDPPEFTLDSVLPGFIRLRARELGSASARARVANANGLQVAIVDGTAAIANGEANNAPMRYVPRSPFELSSTGMPAKVRLYARWQTQRGDVSGWSLPLLVTVL